MTVTAKIKPVIRRGVLRYSQKSRERKGALISAWLDAREAQTVLLIGDLGDAARAGHPNANIVERAVEAGREITMGINVHEIESASHPFQLADARDMPFADDEFDFALANAIIEHVGDEGDQRRMVAETTRVAKCWAITTPNRWFPIESHTSVAFSHWLPSWRAKRKEFTRLLSLREFRSLLPADAQVTGRPWSATFTAVYDSRETA